MHDPSIERAAKLMQRFAERTGLSSDRPTRRYLWTDAFAVCNFLGLARATGNTGYVDLALRLVDQVHHSLGRYREDDPRTGWLSGLSDPEGEAHPTRGGLRIGKRLPERGVEEPIDERLEWDRDGQYFHYLTKWMHALDQVSRQTGDPRYNTWARELAQRAHDTFIYEPYPGAGPRMHWKMSTDLSRALVPSMGQHDPLDGYVTTLQLRATAAALSPSVQGPTLDAALRRFATMTTALQWTSPDPLGMGGLLEDAFRVYQLMRQHAMPDERLLEQLLGAALSSMQHYARSLEMTGPAQYRLAFRELGLAIGLCAVQRMDQVASRLRDKLSALLRYTPIGDEIEAFWLESSHQHAGTWTEHLDINEVMLATRLAPDGFLVLGPA